MKTRLVFVRDFCGNEPEKQFFTLDVELPFSIYSVHNEEIPLNSLILAGIHYLPDQDK